jgi:hypothetical protein
LQDAGDEREERMKFALILGELETHRLEFNFNHLLGKKIIKVDDREVVRDIRLFGEPVKEANILELGEREKIQVRIEKERKFLFGRKYRVFLNDRLIRLYDGA